VLKTQFKGRVNDTASVSLGYVSQPQCHAVCNEAGIGLQTVVTF
jgi:hypothetical protein